ncbi:DUF4255 domain-containing protein [uncultured Thiohalocapsa sp.]|uniref:DUF4255 domain-containing protein n=1 Tax=uncultured Thiohalocapsa sp. TaxID=768990 RepID=UPI0025FD6CF9|nr:DUF4255 domain-containing protein [uncultured Thiohalocapsa sp.]
MASFQGVHGAVTALADRLTARLPEPWRSGSTTARVTVLGSADLSEALSGNQLGLYLYRIAVDPHGRNRRTPAPGPAGVGAEPDRELPVNLHLLLIANAASAALEADLLAWAMLEIANEPLLDLAALVEHDAEWRSAEQASIAPEDISIEDQMRIWDRLGADFTLSAAYVIRTLQLRLRPDATSHGPVRSRVFPSGTV